MPLDACVPLSSTHVYHTFIVGGAPGSCLVSFQFWIQQVPVPQVQ